MYYLYFYFFQYNHGLRKHKKVLCLFFQGPGKTTTSLEFKFFLAYRQNIMSAKNTYMMFSLVFFVQIIDILKNKSTIPMFWIFSRKAVGPLRWFNDFFQFIMKYFSSSKYKYMYFYHIRGAVQKKHTFFADMSAKVFSRPPPGHIWANM